MASFHSNPPLSYYRLGSSSRPSRKLSFFCRRLRVIDSKTATVPCRNGLRLISCFCKATNDVADINEVPIEQQLKDEIERPRFDINLAVILAGFAFEAYTTPPDNIGRREVDAAGCKTVYLSEAFVREIYDGQLFVKLKKGINLPAMDPWGTSDPYVVMQLESQYAKSKVKWGKKEPTWKEDFTFNIKQHRTKNLQVAAWDANLVTPHKRMGDATINLESLCDGTLHEVLVELEGMGGGGKLQLEVKYKTFGEIEEEKKWWRIPFVSEFLQRNGLDSALKMFANSETVPARQFVEYAFGQLKSFNDAYLTKDRFSNSKDSELANYSSDPAASIPSQAESSSTDSLDNTNCSGKSLSQVENIAHDSLDDTSSNGQSDVILVQSRNGSLDNGNASKLATKSDNGGVQSNTHFWKNLAEVVNQSVVQKLGLPASMELKWDGSDLLHRIGLQSQKIAEAGYIESGLAMPEDRDGDNNNASGPKPMSSIPSSLPDIKTATEDLLKQTNIKKATEDLLKQTDSILGALMVLTAAVSKLNNEARLSENRSSESEKAMSYIDAPALDGKKAEEMRALFSTAESAMEAWAMLASSLGHPSFIKSEFEKICFLDNASTDTQVAIWRDSARKRLVIAFRGTEQSKWKDLLTDLMLAPAGLNPERLGGDFRQEVQVHSGFLSAYDSVRTRIISIIKQTIGYMENAAEWPVKWHIYVTGHSLGGALATLLALELSSNQLSKCGAISVTMYNFGSPRVGNRRFAEVYNQKVKDTWRVVNHRDIIPTVPRLMGYCHVAQPVYLAAGDLEDALENLELSTDGYQVDVIAESTPDVLVQEFMKGEKELIEKILQTEINIFRALRDGTALMQHMEDFYYITLLESVRSNYQTARRLENTEQDR